MGMTIAQKILAKAAGKDHVNVGELVVCRVDFCLANDITAPIAIKEFEKLGVDVFDKERIALVPDHFTPNKDIKAAEQCKLVREFARKYNIKYYFEQGRCGIEHVLLPEEGLALPGEVIIGADSHTCTYGALGAFATGVGSTDMAYAWATGEVWFRVPSTIKFYYYGKRKKWVTSKDYILYVIGKIGVDGALYKVMEHTGPAIEELSMDERFTISNMAIEAGAKAGIIPPDEKTLEYVKFRAKRPYTVFTSDEDAPYDDVIEIDVSKIDPIVACPHLPSNVKPAKDLTDITIDQVVIGSCTNGRIEDLRLAAKILKGKKVHPYVRCLIFPGTWNVYKQAKEEGLLDIFLEANCVICPPTCGPCLGGHMGVLASGERAVATTNRNFRGRMGHPDSEVYLASPAVAAASAVLGRIADPEEVAGK